MSVTGEPAEGVLVAAADRPGRRIFATVGNQSQAALEAVRAAANLNDGTLDRLVLVHGGDIAKLQAQVVRDQVVERGIVARNAVTLLQVAPYSAELIGDVDGVVLREIEGEGSHVGVADWHLLFGPGTQPMNVALAGVWFAWDERRNLWYWNSRESMLSGVARAHHVVDARLGFDELVSHRGYTVHRERNLGAPPAGGCPTCAIARDWIYGAGDFRAPVAIGSPPSSDVGSLWEHVVGHLIASMVGAGVFVNVELVNDREAEEEKNDDEILRDREIDVVVKGSGPAVSAHASSAHTVVSCKQTIDRGSASKVFRGAAEEIRVLAERFIGSEGQSLLVALVGPRWEPGERVKPGQMKNLKGVNDRRAQRVRRNARTKNSPSQKHWILHGLELFGDSPESCDAVFRIDWANPQTSRHLASLTVDHQRLLVNLRSWLLGAGHDRT